MGVICPSCPLGHFIITSAISLASFILSSMPTWSDRQSLGINGLPQNVDRPHVDCQIHQGLICSVAQHDDSASVLLSPQFPHNRWSPHPLKVHVQNNEPRHFLAHELQGCGAIAGYLCMKPSLGQKLLEVSAGICVAPYEQDAIGP